MSDSTSILVRAYREVGVPLDQLPFHDEFARLRSLVQQALAKPIDNRTLWTRLLRLRKNGLLPRLRRSENSILPLTLRRQ